ncbi:MAG: phosphoribosylformylglycinamidine cyclo-ligase [Gammaproteobacteria bacterium]
MNDKHLTYRSAGVNIDAGDSLVQRIKPVAARTHRAGVLTGLGGFGGLFELPTDKYSNPVLVSGTDGVGTKLKLAIAHGLHDSIGIDLVAMCVNDIVVTGAEPLFFLDYYATGHLDTDIAASVINGIADGCELAGTALIGGETAEMPGMYNESDYDLAGFAVGIVEKADIIDGTGIKPGDVLLGLPSSGPHSNGYSLIRKILNTVGEDAATIQLDDTSLISSLMNPTRIYVKSLLALIKELPVLAMAHITGGGITENLPRVLPEGLGADICLSSWTLPAVFDWLQESGNIERTEMLRTFNCGIGMIICVKPENSAQTIATLKQQGELAFEIGQVVSNHQGVSYTA